MEQSRLAVTVCRRSDENWTVESLHDPSVSLDLPTIGCALPLSTIYERTLLVR